MNEAMDEELTALLDGQLGETKRADVFKRLAEDKTLQRRFDALARTRAPLDAAFVSMLTQAPVARLGRALPAERQQGFGRGGARLVAALLLTAVLTATLAVWLSLSSLRPRDDWATAVVDYAALYTPETFTNVKSDAAAFAKVAERLGIGLALDALAPPGMTFKTAFVLTYEGAVMGEFVFVDAAGDPYLFCALAEVTKPSALQLETRQKLTLVEWARVGKRFLVIGPNREAIGDWSKSIAGRA